jgi:hypothetical protein
LPREAFHGSTALCGRVFLLWPFGNDLKSGERFVDTLEKTIQLGNGATELRSEIHILLIWHAHLAM